MEYAEARTEIKTGDLLAWSSDTWVGNIIRMGTRSSYSHVGVAMWVQEGDACRLLVAESREGRGVQVLPLSHRSSFEWVKGTDIQNETAMREFVWHTLGRPYDWASILKRVFGLRMASNNRFTCNEFASVCLMKGGALASLQDDPGALMQVVKRRRGRSVIYVETKGTENER